MIFVSYSFSVSFSFDCFIVALDPRRSDCRWGGKDRGIVVGLIEKDLLVGGWRVYDSEYIRVGIYG